MNVWCIYFLISWILYKLTYRTLLYISKHTNGICLLESWIISSHLPFFVPFPTDSLTMPRGDHFGLREEWGHPRRQPRPCRTSKAKREDVECCGQRGHRGGRRSETRRSRWQKRIYGWLGHNQTVFFWGGGCFLRPQNKTERNEVFFFLAVTHFVTVWFTDVDESCCQKTTYQDWRMEEGTPSWNKGKQLRSNEGNNLFQIHQIIIYSFTDPQNMAPSGPREVWRDDKPSATRYQNWHGTSYLKWFEPGLGWWKPWLNTSKLRSG